MIEPRLRSMPTREGSVWATDRLNGHMRMEFEQAVQEFEYGSVEVVIHQGQVQEVRITKRVRA